MSDNDLLTLYRKDRSEDAFSALVGRHVNMVYSTAARHVTSPDLAKEVTQTVFLELAKQAFRLPQDVHLGSWLYVITRRRAIDLIRSERRRMKYETAAVEQAAMGHGHDPDWDSLRPALDDALGELNEAERESVIRRFFEGQGYRDIGAALGIAEDTAQKRVSRTLERLRDRLASRGIISGAAMLAAALEAHATEPAPFGLAQSVMSATAVSIRATSRGVAHRTMTSIISQRVLPIVAVVTVASSLYLAHVCRVQGSKIAVLRRQNEVLAAATDEAGHHSTRAADLPHNRSGEASSSGESEDPQAAVLEQRIRRLKDWATKFPEEASPEMALLTYVDWIIVVDGEPNLDNYGSSGSDMAAQKNAIEGSFVTLDQIASKKLMPALIAAYKRYQMTTGRTKLDNVRDLAPFLEKPAQPSFLKGYSIFGQGTGPNGPGLYYQRIRASWTAGSLNPVQLHGL